MPRPSVIAPTVIAIDWSGARGPGPHRGIWITAIRDSVVIENRGWWRRDEVVRFLADQPGPLVAGFDFSFGFPKWVGEWNGWATGPDGWDAVANDGEAWLRDCPPPFWGKKGTRRSREVELFRECELRLLAKSTFQIAGAGAVGTGSLRGMPLLRDLRDAGFTVWPFDAPSEKTVVEIYPSALRRFAPDLDTGEWTSPDERDAVVSARVMWRYRETVAALRAATDPMTSIEGDVWTPPASLTASP